MEGSEVSTLATSRGMSTKSYEGGRNSPFRLPSSSRKSNELQNSLAGVFLSTVSASGNDLSASAALDVQWLSQGLGRASQQQTARLERSRRAASADAAARKHAKLDIEARSSHAAGAAAAAAASAAPRVTPQRISRKSFVLDIADTSEDIKKGDLLSSYRDNTPSLASSSSYRKNPLLSSSSTRSLSPTSGSPRVVPLVYVMDEYGLPSVSPRLSPRKVLAAEESIEGSVLAAHSATTGNFHKHCTKKFDSPFAPHRLLPRLPSSPPSYTHAPESGRAYPGSHSYHPSSHSFRDREVDKELGPMRAISGVLAAEPRRSFVPGRPGLLDASATARIEREAEVRRQNVGAHPFLSPKTARATTHEPWVPEFEDVAKQFVVVDGGGPLINDKKRRQSSIGRPYMLHPKQCEFLGVDTAWAAWKSPVKRAPDDLRGPLPTSPLYNSRATGDWGKREFRAGESFLIPSTKAGGSVLLEDPPDSVPLGGDLSRRMRKGQHTSSTLESTKLHAKVSDFLGDSSSNDALDKNNTMTAAAADAGALTSASEALLDLQSSASASLTERESLPSEREGIIMTSVERAVMEGGVSGVSPRCASGHGFSPKNLSLNALSPCVGGAPRPSRAAVLRAHAAATGPSPGSGTQRFTSTLTHVTSPRSLSTFAPLCKAAATIDIPAFAASGIDPLLAASHAAAPTGLPRKLSTVPSRWEGPWQNGEVHYDSFSHSPFRDGIAYYRRAEEGAEVLPDSKSISCFRLSSGTLSPRSSARLSLTGSGKDAHLDSPSLRQQAKTVCGNELEGVINGSPAVPRKALLGTLASSLSRSAAEKTLSEALHARKSGFLTRASPRRAI